MYFENIEEWKNFVYEIDRTQFQEFLFAMKKFEVELYEVRKMLQDPDCDAGDLNERNFFSTQWDLYQLCEVPRQIQEIIRR